MKNYTLMHRNIPVMQIEVDSEIGLVSGYKNVFYQDHIPVGIMNQDGVLERKELHNWWIRRSIPMSRSGIRDALELMDVSMPQMLVEKCLALSLSDQYWIRPEGQKIAWEEVNFFNNEFSEDVGNSLFGNRPDSEVLDLMSPDNTSDGCLKKKWKAADGKRYLIKGGNGQIQQEPFNEVFASKVMEAIGNIEFVPYHLIWENEMPYSVCEDFIDEHTELVNASSIMKVLKKPNHISEYQHFMDCCEHLGIPNVKESIDRMLVVDYLIANDDHHHNNFGAVRNAETLEWIGMAPIFDCGNSMWYNQPTSKINTENADTASRTFKNSHAEQIKLVTTFDWLDHEKLNVLEAICNEVFATNPFMDDFRKEKLCKALAVRVEELKNFVQEMSQKNDIEEMNM